MKCSLYVFFFFKPTWVSNVVSPGISTHMDSSFPFTSQFERKQSQQIKAKIKASLNEKRRAEVCGCLLGKNYFSSFHFNKLHLISWYIILCGWILLTYQASIKRLHKEQEIDSKAKQAVLQTQRSQNMAAKWVFWKEGIWYCITSYHMIYYNIVSHFFALHVYTERIKVILGHSINLCWRSENTNPFLQSWLFRYRRLEKESKEELREARRAEKVGSYYLFFHIETEFSIYWKKMKPHSIQEFLSSKRLTAKNRSQSYDDFSKFEKQSTIKR